MTQPSVDPRRKQLDEFKAKLFPEYTCPDCGRPGDPVFYAGKGPSPGFFCYCRSFNPPRYAYHARRADA